MKLKTTIGAALIAGALLSIGAASAAVVNPVTPTLTAWAVPFVDAVDGDTTWTLLGFTGDVEGGTGLTVTETTLGGIDTYIATFDFTKDSTGQFGPNESGTISYRVTISPAAEFWTTGSIDSTCPAGTPQCNVNKVITATPGGTLTSVSGNPGGPIPLGGKTITVVETFTTGANGVLTSATNTYTLIVNRTPEPLSLGLIGIGLAALGFTRRRSAA
jgi:hypothetical protein